MLYIRNGQQTEKYEMQFAGRFVSKESVRVVFLVSLYFMHLAWNVHCREKCSYVEKNRNFSQRRGTTICMPLAVSVLRGEKYRAIRMVRRVNVGEGIARTARRVIRRVWIIHKSNKVVEVGQGEVPLTTYTHLSFFILVLLRFSEFGFHDDKIVDERSSARQRFMKHWPFYTVNCRGLFTVVFKGETVIVTFWAFNTLSEMRSETEIL